MGIYCNTVTETRKKRRGVKWYATQSTQCVLRDSTLPIFEGFLVVLGVRMGRVLLRNVTSVNQSGRGLWRGVLEGTRGGRCRGAVLQLYQVNSSGKRERGYENFCCHNRRQKQKEKTKNSHPPFFFQIILVTCVTTVTHYYILLREREVIVCIYIILQDFFPSLILPQPSCQAGLQPHSLLYFFFPNLVYFFCTILIFSPQYPLL